MFQKSFSPGVSLFASDEWVGYQVKQQLCMSLLPGAIPLIQSQCDSGAETDIFHCITEQSHFLRRVIEMSALPEICLNYFFVVKGRHCIVQPYLEYHFPCQTVN